MNTMNLSFNDSTKELFAICSVEFESSMDELRFSLSDKMSFDNIDADAPAKLSKTRDWQPTFADHCNEYSITGGFRTLTVTYHGKPQGWCNIIEERRIALSSYSSWFPFGDELPSDWLIRLDGMPDYIVINGEYDAARNVWTYGQKGFDVGNIILLKASQWNRVEDGDFSFWYANEREQEFAAIFAKTYRDVVNYYNSIYPAKELGSFNLISLDMERCSGAYFRKGIIVFDRLPEVDSKDRCRYAVSWLGHELGHSWFSGADTNSWEDWLNETGAEWSCLLFVLEHFGAGMFDELMALHLQNYKGTPTIRPAGTDKRPTGGVHDRGVVLFYLIARRFGYNIVKRILQLLTALPKFTTADLLSAMRRDTSREVVEAADIIDCNLTSDEYYDQ